jgi:hypothetical protein
MNEEVAAAAALLSLAILYKKVSEQNSRPLEIKSVYVSEPVIRELYQNRKTGGFTNWSNKPLDNVIINTSNSENIANIVEKIQLDYRNAGSQALNDPVYAPSDGGYIRPQLAGSLNIQWIDPTSYNSPVFVQPVSNANQFGANPIYWQ